MATMVIGDMDRKAEVRVVIEARDMEDLVMQLRRMLSQIEVHHDDGPALPLPDLY